MLNFLEKFDISRNVAYASMWALLNAKSRLLKASDGGNAGVFITLFDQFGKNKLFQLPADGSFLFSHLYALQNIHAINADYFFLNVSSYFPEMIKSRWPFRVRCDLKSSTWQQHHLAWYFAHVWGYVGSRLALTGTCQIFNHIYCSFNNLVALFWSSSRKSIKALVYRPRFCFSSNETALQGNIGFAILDRWSMCWSLSGIEQRDWECCRSGTFWIEERTGWCSLFWLGKGADQRWQGSFEKPFIQRSLDSSYIFCQRYWFVVFVQLYIISTIRDSVLNVSFHVSQCQSSTSLQFTFVSKTSIASLCLREWGLPDNCT